MKRTLGLLALTVAVSAVASADQDYIKNFNFSTELRQTYQDNNGIGISPLKGENRTRTRWQNIVSGTIVLADEGDFGLDFWTRNRNDRVRGGAGNHITRKDDYWKTILELNKKGNIGKLDTTWRLGWEHETHRRKNNGDDSFATTGISNQLYAGPSFEFGLLGHDISTDVQAVYFTSKGDRGANYATELKTKNSTEGWGANLNLVTGKDVAKGNWGKVGYSVELYNKFRDGNASGEKSNVYLDYILTLKYTTPTFWGGFYADAAVSNEWEKYTGSGTYYNTAELWTSLGYKKTFATSLGNLSVNPFVKYKPWDRETSKEAGSERVTEEYNEWRAGLSLGLAVR